ncbi:uncharacterized protein LOC118188896 [Stegodyphus dumicola]|uniref:uncharacterized protein LOC118188896 n=1 Tax=Stegodyphus dumicola TaxID=202533 RepID=UPI0015B0C78C|nr:uncharacterized protein LOC118188896 [Stegodyphus dumicola]
MLFKNFVLQSCVFHIESTCFSHINLLQRSAELFEEVCRVKINPDGDAVLWADREHSTFSTCFRLSKSSEEESSDSDEESQVFETENAPIVLSSEEIKMDVDNHEAIFDGVPMDVAPVTIPNPWESTETTSSDDQGNWADFSNFAAFGASTSEHSEAVSVAMETSDSATSCEKCVTDTSLVSSVENVRVSEELGSPSNVALSDRQKSGEKSGCEIGPVGSASTLSSDKGGVRAESSNRQKDLTALFDEETCSATSVQNGPVCDRIVSTSAQFP